MLFLVLFVEQTYVTNVERFVISSHRQYMRCAREKESLVNLYRYFLKKKKEKNKLFLNIYVEKEKERNCYVIRELLRGCDSH